MFFLIDITAETASRSCGCVKPFDLEPYKAGVCVVVYVNLLHDVTSGPAAVRVTIAA